MLAQQKRSMIQQCNLRVWKNFVIFILIWSYLSAVLVLVFYGNSGYVSNTVLYSTKANFSTQTAAQKAFSTSSPLLRWWNSRTPFIDHTQENRSESDVLTSLQRKYPNLPFIFWNSVKWKNLKANKSCAPLPNVYGLEFSNVIWQSFRSSNGTYHIFGAYYDNRSAVEEGSVVRILIMLDRVEPTLTLHCQLWNSSSTVPYIAQMKQYRYLWNKKWGNYRSGILQPFLLTCPVPRSYVPNAVSVVEKPCDSSTNLIRVLNERLPPKRSKQNFAVCVKGLDFPHEDLSVRLIEWLELLKLLGVHRVFLYELDVHPNISKVVQYYSSARGASFVQSFPLTLPGGQPNFPELLHLYLRMKVNTKRQNEIIPYNDCFYRNIYRYHYVVLLDIDEVIMPVVRTNWVDLMNDAIRAASAEGGAARASYNVRNVYFFDDLQPEVFGDIPRFMHILQHVHRSKNFTRPGQFVKCFHSTERVLSLHNHFPTACLSKSCRTFSVSTDDAQLNHYRKDCVKVLNKSCGAFRANITEDKISWRYKDKLINNTLKVMTSLGILPDRDV